MDWQFTRFTSPVFDLMDILLITSDKEIRAKNYHNVVQHYYDTLSTSIERLGSDPTKLFTFEDLQGQLKKFGKYSFYIAITSTVALLPDECIPSSSELCKTVPTADSNVTEYIKQYDEKTEITLRTRISDLFTDLLAWGYTN